MKKIIIENAKNSKWTYRFEKELPDTIDELLEEWNKVEVYNMVIDQMKIRIAALIRTAFESKEEDRIRSLGEMVKEWRPMRKAKMSKVEKAKKIIEKLSKEEFEELIKRFKEENKEEKE